MGERFGGFALALMEKGACDGLWSAVHMTPKEFAQTVQELRGEVLYCAHNSPFDLAFQTRPDPFNRLADLAAAKGIEVGTPQDPAR